MEHFSVVQLPDVITPKILSYLTWEEKLDVVAAIPTWKKHSRTTEAWPVLRYEEVYPVNLEKSRERVEHCIASYGNYMPCIHIVISKDGESSGLCILKQIAHSCSNVRHLWLGINCEYSGRGVMTWDREWVEAMCKILVKCETLKSVALDRIIPCWSDTEEINPLLALVKGSLAKKVTKLNLAGCLWWDHEDYCDELRYFVNLKTLVVRRAKLSEDLLKVLVGNKLQELRIYQDEELPEYEPLLYTNATWQYVKSHCPSFSVDLVMSEMIVVRSLFPCNVPLRSLLINVMHDEVTKGLIDSLISHYKNTLETFACFSSLVGVNDRRVPASLVEMAEKCVKLRRIIYTASISSTTVLLIAKTKQLEELVVDADELTFEFDWHIRPEWSPSFVNWLREGGSSAHQLQKEVSLFLGKPWTISTDEYINKFESFLSLD